MTVLSSGIVRNVGEKGKREISGVGWGLRQQVRDAEVLRN